MENLKTENDIINGVPQQPRAEDKTAELLVSSLAHRSKDMVQGIEQTGEEDPLSCVDDPLVASALRANAELTPSLDHSSNEENSASDIAVLSRLSAALTDSVEGYEIAARNGEELLRPIFLQRANERREMVNEFQARMSSMGAIIEAQTDECVDFANTLNESGPSFSHILDSVEEHEASLRSAFLDALEFQTNETVQFLRSQYLVIERSEEELRRLRSEFRASD